MKQLFSGVMVGAAVWIFLDMMHVNNPLPVAVLIGALWAWLGKKASEEK